MAPNLPSCCRRSCSLLLRDLRHCQQIGYYVSVIVFVETLKSFRNQLCLGLAISSSHAFQELTQSGLILPKLGCLLLNCFPAFWRDNGGGGGSLLRRMSIKLSGQLLLGLDGSVGCDCVCMWGIGLRLWGREPSPQQTAIHLSNHPEAGLAWQDRVTWGRPE